MKTIIKNKYVGFFMSCFLISLIIFHIIFTFDDYFGLIKEEFKIEKISKELLILLIKFLGRQNKIQRWLNDHNIVKQFTYFTIWTNNLAIITWFVEKWFFKKTNPYWKMIIMLNVLITCSVFLIALFPFIIKLLIQSKGVNWLFFYIVILQQHFLIFVYAFYWFYKDNSKKILTKTKSIGLMMIIPIIYGFFSIIMYFLTDQGIYPFINFGDWNYLDLDCFWSITLSILSYLLMVFLFLGASYFIFWWYKKVNEAIGV